MSLKLLTFLGLGNYQEVTYCWNQQEYRTRLFPEALAAWLKPDEILVLLTPEAKASQHWKDLQLRLNELQLASPQPIDIPSGKSEKELWEIFSILTRCLDGQRPVVFDVTHAFRSLPILALLAIAYLRVAHMVRLQRLLYGAFEARVNDRAPVFDLTPFVGLLDWVTATDQFLRTGNAEALTGLLPEGEQVTKELSENVYAIAQALHFLRPMDVMRESALLPDRIAAAAPSISATVPPFSSLTQKVHDGYGGFGLNNAVDFIHNGKAALMCQLRMIEWYADKDQIVHALSLAREWLPSLLCHFFHVDPFDKANREDMELLLGGGKMKDNDGNTIRESSRLSDWPNVPCGKKLRGLWGGGKDLANLRNDVLHAGFRKKPKTAREIARVAAEIITELRAIASEWKLEEVTS